MNHENYYKGYALGFLFSEDLKHVILIRKNRPSYLEGKLNGVGGKIEPGESHKSAMIREFKEETGVQFEEWTYLKSFIVRDGLPVHTFYGVGNVDSCKSPTDEKIWKMNVNRVLKEDFKMASTYELAVEKVYDMTLISGARELIVESIHRIKYHF